MAVRDSNGNELVEVREGKSTLVLRTEFLKKA